jgi:quercetin dioxygenase-like cupin family protein
MTRRPTRTALATVGGVALVAVGYTAGVSQGDTTAAVARDALAQSTTVRGGADRTLALTKVTVPAGAQLALHHHPGTQISSVQQGTLTYTVKTGQVQVMSGQADAAKPVRTIKAGQTGSIAPGQWIVEQPNEIHRAANRGSTKVVILLATLFPRGAPPSLPND